MKAAYSSSTQTKQTTLTHSVTVDLVEGAPLTSQLICARGGTSSISGPRCEETCLRGFRPGPT